MSGNVYGLAMWRYLKIDSPKPQLNLLILSLGIIRRLEQNPISEQNVENIFIAPPYCQTNCCSSWPYYPLIERCEMSCQRFAFRAKTRTYLMVYSDFFCLYSSAISTCPVTIATSPCISTFVESCVRDTKRTSGF